MRKTITTLLTSILLFGLSVAYNPTPQDYNLLSNFYNKIDKIAENNKEKANNLVNKIDNIITNYDEDSRIYFFLDEIQKYTEDKIIENKKGYEIIDVIDGDTVKVNYNGEKRNVRLLGIDTPESNTARYGYAECYGEEAKKHLTDMIEGERVKLEFDESQGKTGSYGRLLAYIWYQGNNINSQMLQDGYAWEYTYDDAYKYQDKFKKIEKGHKNTKYKKGLWKENTCGGERVKDEEYRGNGNKEEEKSSSENYSCGSKEYCGDMNSCDEAKYYLNQCGVDSLDGDGNGVPCESLCE